MAWSCGNSTCNVRTFVVLIAAIAVPLVLGAGYWLLRNTVVHHNPLYPITMLGLPGVDLKTISIVKPALADSFWKRATYPWVQWQFGYPYDDALGAVFPAVALISFVAVFFRRARGTRRGLVWFITAASYLLWLNTGSIMARFGIFPILLTFVFVGEAWREFESLALKVVTLATFAFGVGVISYSMVFGAVYSASVATESDVPTVVDRLPPSRIFNATSASNRYALLGKDYRHEVITMFRDPVPSDLTNSRAQYVLLGQKQIAAFSAAEPLQLVESGRGLYGDTLSLWRVGR